MNQEDRDTSYQIWSRMMSIYRMWYREAEKRLVNSGMSIMEFRMLKTLNEKGPLPMVKLAESNFITQGWVTSLIDRLEAKHYVERTRKGGDRRIVSITVTDEGVKFYRTIKEIHEEYIFRTLECLNVTDKGELNALLGKIEEKLMSQEGPVDTEVGDELIG